MRLMSMCVHVFVCKSNATHVQCCVGRLIVAKTARKEKEPTSHETAHKVTMGLSTSLGIRHMPNFWLSLNCSYKYWQQLYLLTERPHNFHLNHLMAFGSNLNSPWHSIDPKKIHNSPQLEAVSENWIYITFLVLFRFFFSMCVPLF